jgi:hypothetical protein
MDESLYWVGVLLAIGCGIANNIGTLLQKMVVNEHKNDKEFMKHLVKNGKWLFGLILQMAIGAVFFMLAQIYLGPALIPGLMAAGLIVLAIGSVKIIHETLKLDEIIGIFVMIGGITLLGFSGLAIDLVTTNLLDTAFVLRITFFTLLFVVLMVVFYIAGKKIERFRAILYSIVSGFMFAVSNYWISPLMAVIGKVFAGNFVPGELVYFVLASIILPLTNILGIGVLQKAFLTGQASNLVPIQQVPVQIAPIGVYFYLFLLPAPSTLAIVLGAGGIVLILISSFILARRQVAIENIGKAETKPDTIPPQ